MVPEGVLWDCWPCAYRALKWVLYSNHTMANFFSFRAESSASDTDKKDDSNIVIVDRKANPPIRTGAQGTHTQLAGARRGTSTMSKFSQPPEITCEVQCRFKGYFYCAGVTAASCTRATIAGALGSTCITATTLVAQATSFKIRRILIWSASVSSTINESFISWSFGTAEQALVKDDQKVRPVVGGTVPNGASIWKPPKGSYAAMWQRCNVGASPSETLFQITVGNGSVVLLEADFTLGSAIQALVSPGAALGLTSGNYYRYSLDTTASGNVVKSLVASAF